MKKGISAVLILLALLLSACGTAPSASSKKSEPLLEPESSVSSPDTTTPVEPVNSESVNPYNSQTAVTDEYIFAQTQGAIYRIDRESGASEVFINEEKDGLIVGYSYMTLAAYDNYLYFLSPNRLLSSADQEAIDDFELGLYRVDAEKSVIEKVGSVQNRIFTLQNISGYLVLHDVGDMPGLTNATDIAPDDAFKVFVPDPEASQLEEFVYSSLDEEERDTIERFVYLYLESAELEERLYNGTLEEGFGPVVRADDAYYFLFTTGGVQLYKAPLLEGGEKEIKLAEDTAQYLLDAGWAEIVNYDSEWLYLKTYTDLVKIKKDGSEHEVIVADNIGITSFVDIVDGHAIYQGTDGIYYFDSIPLSG